MTEDGFVFPECKYCTDYRYGGCDECGCLYNIVEDDSKRYFTKEELEDHIEDLINKFNEIHTI